MCLFQQCAGWDEPGFKLTALTMWSRRSAPIEMLRWCLLFSCWKSTDYVAHILEVYKSIAQQLNHLSSFWACYYWIGDLFVLLHWKLVRKSSVLPMYAPSYHLVIDYQSWKYILCQDNITLKTSDKSHLGARGIHAKMLLNKNLHLYTYTITWWCFFEFRILGKGISTSGQSIQDLYFDMIQSPLPTVWAKQSSQQMSSTTWTRYRVSEMPYLQMVLIYIMCR